MTRTMVTNDIDTVKISWLFDANTGVGRSSRVVDSFVTGSVQVLVLPALCGFDSYLVVIS